MSFYEDNEIETIEKAILAEDLNVNITDNTVIGKFYVPVLTPELDTSEIKEIRKAGYETSNYISLPIPRYLLIHFAPFELVKLDNIDKPVITLNDEFVISKGTEFFIEFLGGEIEIDKINIIGIGVQS